MSARHTTRGPWGALSGFFAIPAGVAGLVLAAPLMTGAAAPGLAVAPGSGSPPPTVNPCLPQSGTATSAPAPSPGASAPAPDVLCIAVQSLDTSGDVAPGAQASFAISVWLAGTVDGTATVTLATQPSTLVPSFTVCPSLTGNQCMLTLTAGQPDELQAAIAVPTNALGDTITLTATGSSPQAPATATGSASVVVANPPSPTPAPTPTPTPTPTSTPTPTPKATTTTPKATATTPAAGTDVPAPVGVGLTLPAGNVPGSVPTGSLPLLPNPAANPGVTFPKVTPGPSTASPPHQIRVTDVSASFPLDTRLIGGQIVGLAVLAAAVAIAVARFSLRRSRPRHSKDPQRSKDP